MECELISVQLLIQNEVVNGKLKIFEESPESNDLVLLVLEYDNITVEKGAENLFDALQLLRKDLEKRNIQIMCNGAALNVYPSPMQLSMGSGRTAHLLKLGKQTAREDIVDIFDYDKTLSYVSIIEQEQFHNSWLKSIIGR